MFWFVFIGIVKNL